MEWISLLLAGLGGLGIGSVLATIANHFMSRRASVNDRWYQEKREAYLGLLNALEPGGDDARGYRLWNARCALFGSSEVLKYAKEVDETPYSADAERNAARKAAFQNMLGAMRDDLRR
jgi:hypothetical protein